MKLTKTTATTGLAIGLVLLLSAPAAAQAPTLSSSVNGSRVTIQWTPVAGATGYDIIVTGILSGRIQLPASNTLVSVDAPAGTYNVQVRGTANGAAGPLSNLVSFTVGSGNTPPPGPCTLPSGPTVTATTAGGVVTLNWTAVAGAASYTLQFSRFAGGTELAQTVSAGTTTYSQFVAMVGTFFARVIVNTPCGSAASAEVSFTIASQTASGGPRTPNPTPGQLIPRASLGYALGIIEQTARQFDGDLQNSCVERGGNNAFMFRVVNRLRAIDSRWGMNDKRGQLNDMSQDILSYNPTDRPDNGESQIYLFDVIANHCGSGRADVWMNDVTDVTWAQRGNPACGTTYCARWTINRYLAGGNPPDERQ